VGYRHYDVTVAQSPKRGGQPCGDLVCTLRTPDHTLVVCADGLGSGIRANLAANMCASRLVGLVRGGYSLREAFDALVRTMNAAREPGLPYMAFSILRLGPDGDATVLTYDAPAPVLVTYHTASPLRMRTADRDGAETGEAVFRIAEHEGVVLMSDGITQAGIGNGRPLGWPTKAVARFLRDQITSQAPLADLPRLVHGEARKIWGDLPGDDCTVCLVSCRAGRVVNVFTGPPRSKAHDGTVVRAFLDLPGVHVVCGGTTARIVADALGVEVAVEQDDDPVAPPRYRVEGVDLVTEGAVTLNQVYNILGEDTAALGRDSGVFALGRLLREADRVNFITGTGENAANGDIAFRQQGILPRATIVPLVARKLREAGKLVDLRQV
jgi:hypothetical protein